MLCKPFDWRVCFLLLTAVELSAVTLQDFVRRLTQATSMSNQSFPSSKLSTDEDIWRTVSETS